MALEICALADDASGIRRNLLQGASAMTITSVAAIASAVIGITIACLIPKSAVPIDPRLKEQRDDTSRNTDNSAEETSAQNRI